MDVFSCFMPESFVSKQINSYIELGGLHFITNIYLNHCFPGLSI